MRISELIEELQELLLEEGNLEIFECDDEGHWYTVHPYPEDKENFIIVEDFLPKRFIYLS